MRGRCIVVGGHSRGVGKTALVVALVRALGGTPVATVKVSAHRHGSGDVAIVEDRDPAAHTSTGRCLQAGAQRAFLCRCPDEHLPAAAAFVRELIAGGWTVIVESNRLAGWLQADDMLFVVSAATRDWKPSVRLAAPRTDALVLAPGTESIPMGTWLRAGGALDPPVLRFTDQWSVPGLGPWLAARRCVGAIAGPSAA
jgi:hypothetical protein